MEQTYRSSCCAHREQQNLPLRAEFCKPRDKPLPRARGSPPDARPGLEPRWASRFVSAQQPVLEQSEHGSRVSRGRSKALHAPALVRSALAFGTSARSQDCRVNHLAQGIQQPRAVPQRWKSSDKRNKCTCKTSPDLFSGSHAEKSAAASAFWSVTPGLPARACSPKRTEGLLPRGGHRPPASEETSPCPRAQQGPAQSRGGLGAGAQHWWVACHQPRGRGDSQQQATGVPHPGRGGLQGGDDGSTCSRSSPSNGTLPVLSRQLWFPGSLSPT